MADDETKSVADETEMSIDAILSGEGDTSIAEERLGPDERDRLEEKRSAAPAEPEQPAAPEAAPEGQTAAPDSLDDVPGFLRAKPEDAQHWRELRTIAKDAQRDAREARETRVRLEAEIAALKAQQQRAPVQQPRPLPSIDEDPGAHIAALRAEMKADVESARLDMSEAAAVQQHGKARVDEAFAWYQATLANEPAIENQMRTAQHPWGFIVDEKARREALAEMGGDPAKYRETMEAGIREKVRAEILAEMEAEKAGAVEAAIRQRLPTSLATVPGRGNSSADAYAGPTPMGQIIESGLDS